MVHTPCTSEHVDPVLSGVARRAAACASLLFLVLAGCSGETNSAGTAAAGAAGQPAVPVLAAPASSRSVPVELHAIGSVEAYSSVTVKSQVEGQIERVHFDEGQEVKTGDLLFTIDARPFHALLMRAEAQLARDEAELRNARAEAERYASLSKAGIVSKDQSDRFQTNADALDAAVRADAAQVETARLNLGYCTIRSPIDGQTGRLLVHSGNVVKANDTNLVVINRIAPIYVTFSVPQEYLDEIRRFMADRHLGVRASVSDEREDSEPGVLSFVDNTVNRATGTIELKATFPNAGRRLWPGQFVDAYLELTAHENATVVPSQAVQTGEGEQYVYVVQPDMTADYRKVVVGSSYEGDTVIDEGLQPGEQVVTDGQLRLFPGARVTVKSGLHAEQGDGP